MMIPTSCVLVSWCLVEDPDHALKKGPCCRNKGFHGVSIGKWGYPNSRLNGTSYWNGWNLYLEKVGNSRFVEDSWKVFSVPIHGRKWLASSIGFTTSSRLTSATAIRACLKIREDTRKMFDFSLGKMPIFSIWCHPIPKNQTNPSVRVDFPWTPSWLGSLQVQHQSDRVW